MAAEFCVHCMSASCSRESRI